MSLYEFFYDNYNSDTLKEFVRMLGGSSKLTRKDERARHIVDALLDPAQVRVIWGEMDEISRKAVASAYHNDGFFNASAFLAQYGQLPERPRKYRWSWSGEPILLDLLINNNRIHQELMPILADLVPPPDRFQIEGLEEVPMLEFDGYEVEPLRADTEEAGWHDLLLYLQLIDQGEIRLSSTSARLTAASVETLVDKLLQGDFFPLDEEKRKFDETIRPYGLTQFAIGAELIASYRKGGLTQKGRAFLNEQDPELLLQALETWTEKSKFDELTRIDAIKGMRARGVKLTEPSLRRERIVEALSWCPTGVWIPIEDFYRAVKIWHFDFEIEAGGLDKLYVGRRSQYEAWASWEDMWILTNGLYINTVLWEYLATIGALDLVYLRASEVDVDAEAYYYDELTYSRYDGLTYFRINPLGAYLFGQSAEYEPVRPADESFFVVSADRRLKLLDPAQLTPVVAARLAQLATPEAEQVYRLDDQKILAALDEGMDVETVHDFLVRRNRGPLPVEVDGWIAQLDANSRAFSVKSNALLIRAGSVELAQTVLEDAVLGKYTRTLDDRTLVIPASYETRFRNRLRELGYGIRK